MVAVARMSAVLNMECSDLSKSRVREAEEPPAALTVQMKREGKRLVAATTTAGQGSENSDADGRHDTYGERIITIQRA
jgi:hypothetical protein